MKEVTYEDWLKNPVPRNMWVWNSNEQNKEKQKVIYFLNPNLSYPIITSSFNEKHIDFFKHCAEIEKSKIRRMTNKELSRWLRENPTREYKYAAGSCIYTSFDYKENKQNVEIYEDICIRENDGEWKEPLIEVTDD